MLIIGTGKDTQGSQHQLPDSSMGSLGADPEARITFTLDTAQKPPDRCFLILGLRSTR